MKFRDAHGSGHHGHKSRKNYSFPKLGVTPHGRGKPADGATAIEINHDRALRIEAGVK
jgi:hypothetical protein